MSEWVVEFKDGTSMELSEADVTVLAQLGQERAELCRDRVTITQSDDAVDSDAVDSDAWAVLHHPDDADNAAHVVYGLVEVIREAVTKHDISDQ